MKKKNETDITPDVLGTASGEELLRRVRRANSARS